MTDPIGLSQPHVRRELRMYLLELLAADPRPIWNAQAASGLASGIDQIFHFFFDDHDFDDASVGAYLFDGSELRLVTALKYALEQVLEAVGDSGDDAFVEHPLWAGVRQAATTANAGLRSDGVGS